MMKIFVSYRRDDSAGWTGRLVEDLAQRFGAKNVFQDIESIEPGTNFVSEINRTLLRANCTLVVIGPAWLTLADQHGQRRLDNAGDYVRLEVAAALSRISPVIPILVGGAKMPTAIMLPDDLKPLAQRNAVEVTDRRWSDDVDQLMASLTGRIWWRRIIPAVAGFVQVIFICIWIYQDALNSTMSKAEANSASIHDAFVSKMQVGSNECMAGVWPKGATKGKTYHQNGDVKTNVCAGVSGELDYFGQLFTNDNLWRLQPSHETAAKFASVFEETFGDGVKELLSSGWSPPLNAAALLLAEEAKNDLMLQGARLVEYKKIAGSASDRLVSVHALTKVGLYWTVALVSALILWFVRRRKKSF